MLVVIPLLFALFMPLIGGSVTFLVDGKEQQTVETFNHMYEAFDAFRTQGYLVMASLNADDGTCKATVPRSNATMGDWKESVVAVRWKEAHERCRLRTFSQLWHIVKRLLADLQDLGYPPCNTLVVASDVPYAGEVGNPAREHFIGKNPGMPESPPPKWLHVAYVRYEHWEGNSSLADALQGHTVGLVVQGEQSSWNQQFGRLWFRMFNGSLALACFVCLLYTLNQFAQFLAKQETLAWNMRYTIFVLDAIGTFLYMLLLLSNTYSYVDVLLGALSNAIVTLAFHLLVYLLSTLLLGIEDAKWIRACRVVIIFSAVLCIAAFSRTMVNHHAPRHTMPGLVNDVIIITSAVSRVLFSLVFAMFTALILYKAKQGMLSPQTQASLLRLAALGGVAFVSYITIAITGSMEVQVWKITAKRAMLTRCAAEIALTARALAILAVLGVRPPQETPARTTTISKPPMLTVTTFRPPQARGTR